MKKYQVHTEWLNSKVLAQEIQKLFQEKVGLEIFLSEKDVE